jgi:hypothetical protein
MTLRCAAQVDYSGLVLPLNTRFNTRFADFGFRHMIHVMKNDVPRALCVGAPWRTIMCRF